METTLLNRPSAAWNRLSNDALKEKGYWPNRVAWDVNTKQLVITIRQSKPGGDFGLNQAAFERAKKVSAEGWRVYIALVRPDETFIAQEDLETVAAKIGAVEPMTGQWGPYWWVSNSFEVIHPGGTGDSCPI